ncbi:MAG: hypothetical protein HUT38_02360 [Candidatus Paceibacter sp.]|nr:hypothetical protein [Candidatus Paceibacter sp.]
MKTLKQSIIAVVVGLALAYGISFASDGQWHGPTANPPAENVPAPINVGSLPQDFANGKTLKVKNGAGVLDLLAGLKISGVFQLVDGSQGKEKVLTSDANGVASWQDQPVRSVWVSKNKSEDGVAPDSEGWFHLEPGQKTTFTHGLNTNNTLVYLEGKNEAGEIHQMNLGTDSGKGAAWKNKTATNITIKRGDNDGQAFSENKWRYIRVIMLKVGN